MTFSPYRGSSESARLEKADAVRQSASVRAPVLALLAQSMTIDTFGKVIQAIDALREQLEVQMADEVLEEKFNQLELDVDMMYMDESASNHQIATKSSEKATKQQFLKDVEREKAYLEIQVDVYGKKPEVKAKEVAKIINEMKGTRGPLPSPPSPLGDRPAGGSTRVMSGDEAQTRRMLRANTQYERKRKRKWELAASNREGQETSTALAGTSQTAAPTPRRRREDRFHLRWIAAAATALAAAMPPRCPRLRR